MSFKVLSKKDFSNYIGRSCFDSEFYKLNYPDVLDVKLEPSEHYRKYGYLLGRKPCPHLNHQDLERAVFNESNEKVYAGIASIPSRITNFRKVVKNILPQIDYLFVYLNNYSSIPDFLNHPKIITYTSLEYGDLRDNGKFFSLFKKMEGYFFTLDDDIYYPQNYVSKLISKINLYDKKAAVGVHGVIYAESPKGFFDRIPFHFEKELSFDTPVSVLGTGTVAFHTSILKEQLNLKDVYGMADLVFSSHLKKSNIPLISIEREEGWLVEYPRLDNHTSIYIETKNDTSPYDNFLKLHAPWGVQQIKSSLQTLNIGLPNITQDFLKFFENIEKGKNHDQIISSVSFKHTYYLQKSGLTKLIMDACIANLLSNLTSSAFKIKNDKSRLVISAIEKMLSVPEGSLSIEQLSSFNNSSVLESLKSLSENHDYIEARAILAAKRTVNEEFSTESLVDFCRSIKDAGQVNEFIGLTSFLIDSIDRDLGLISLRNCLEDNDIRYRNFIKFLNTNSQKPVELYLTGLLYIHQNIDVGCVLEKLMFSKARHKYKNKYIKLLCEVLKLRGIVFQYPEKIVKVISNSEISREYRFQVLAVMVQNRVFSFLHDKSMDMSVVCKELCPEDELDLWLAEIRSQLTNDTSFNEEALINRFVNQGMDPQPLKAFLSGSDEVYSFKQSDPVKKYTCTVIMAAYNAEDTLQSSYDSICAQTISHALKVIIVDDCSNIDVQDYLNINDAVETVIIRNSQNSGPYVCRNIALANLDTDYFVIHDSDDWAHPLKLELQIENMRSDDNLVASYTRHIRLTNDKHLKLENHSAFLGHGPMTSLFKSQIIQEIGGFDSVLTRGDMEFKSRLSSFYGLSSIHEEERITVIALDWHSNSKSKTSTVSKKAWLSKYKNNYRFYHFLSVFGAPYK